MDDFENWSYRGEGSHNLVISHKQACIVYRLLKRKTFSDQAFYVNKQDSDADLRQRLDKSVSFINNVVLPLLGDGFTPSVEVVDLPVRLLEEMKRSIKYKYPGCEQVHPVAMKMPDVCFLPQSSHQQPTFCFEIKPNVLMMPKTEASSEDKLGLKQYFCRHCFTQVGKKMAGVWPKVCKSCPLDLASGNPVRIKRALRRLMDTPHNRLRIFKNGECIYNKHKADPQRLAEHLKLCFSPCQSSHESVIDNALEVVTKALLHVPSDDKSKPQRIESSPQIPHNSSIEDCTGPGQSLLMEDVVQNPAYTCTVMRHINNKAEGTPPDCVLSRIKAMQTLGEMDLEKIYPLYSQLLQSGPLPDLTDYTDSDWQAIASGVVCQDDASSVIRKLKQFLVYLTMKACSIMITIQPVLEQEKLPSNIFHVSGPGGQQYKVSITVLDLDPKPAAKIPACLELDRLYLDMAMQQFCPQYVDTKHSDCQTQTQCRKEVVTHT